MPDHGPAPFRSWKTRPSGELGIRIALALATAIVGYFAVAHSLAQVMRSDKPEQAHWLAPYDGRMTAALAAKMAGLEATPQDRTAADRWARIALRQDRTAVAAVATLGLNAHLRGDTDTARRYFAYSDELSRRDLRTRLWLIEDAVSRDDIPGALRHYDIALRTSRSAPALLYPVLTSAISDVAIRDELVKTLAGAPNWADGFVGYVADGRDAVATASLFRGLQRAGVVVADDARARVIAKLIANSDHAAAWTYYASGRDGADRRRSRDARFDVGVTAPSPFDWVPLGEGGISSAIQSGEGGGVFDFAAPMSVGGPLLQQLQFLPQGDYVIEGRSSGIDQGEAERPYWSLNCADGRELGRVVLGNSTTNGGRFRGSFAVPTACEPQYLRFFAQPSSAVGGLSGQLNQVQLRPLE